MITLLRAVSRCFSLISEVMICPDSFSPYLLPLCTDPDTGALSPSKRPLLLSSTPSLLHSSSPLLSPLLQLHSSPPPLYSSSSTPPLHLVLAATSQLSLSSCVW